MKRTLEPDIVFEEVGEIPELPAEIWLHTVSFLDDEKDYRALALAVPVLARYLSFHGPSAMAKVKRHFGHWVRVETDPRHPGDRTISWKRHGHLHRLGRPAYFRVRKGYHGRSFPRVAKLYRDGKLHSDFHRWTVFTSNYIVYYTHGHITEVQVKGDRPPKRYLPDPYHVGWPGTSNAELLANQFLSFGIHRHPELNFIAVFQCPETGRRGHLVRQGHYYVFQPLSSE